MNNPALEINYFWGSVGTLIVFLLGFVALVYMAVGNLPGKTLAVAQAAYRESIRQPLFWFLLIIAAALMLLLIFIPYFTMGEDLKMAKELSLSTLLLPPLILVLFVSSLSVAEEIEGRTAVTLLSKPVARRQFILGKFFGILAAALLMILILTLIMGLTVNIKVDYDKIAEEMSSQPEHFSYTEGVRVIRSFTSTLPQGLSEIAAYLMRIGLVCFLLGAGSVCVFCQVAIMTSLSVALATRLPFVLNLLVCLVIFVVGTLAPVLAAKAKDIALVKFIANLFGIFLPNFSMFKLDTVLASGIIIVPWVGYVAHVVLHAIFFCTIAVFLGLILFEDRDVA